MLSIVGQSPAPISVLQKGSEEPKKGWSVMVVTCSVVMNTAFKRRGSALLPGWGGGRRPESFCVCRAHGNTPFVKSPLSPYSPLGFLCHEKHYFWIKLNVGFLKIKEQPLCCLLPFQKPFLCLPNAGAPDIEAY